jgi:hypothetical protein
VVDAAKYLQWRREVVIAGVPQQVKIDVLVGPLGAARKKLNVNMPRVRPNGDITAGRLNRMKRGCLTPEGRQRLREAALRNRPWDHATGPRTPAGKAQAAKNGKKRQVGPRSIREIRAELTGEADLIRQMHQGRGRVEQALVIRPGEGSPLSRSRWP